MRYLFLLFTCILYASPELPFPEDDPTLFHHVNVITGNLNFSVHDTEVHGAESLNITRSYSSSGAHERTLDKADLYLRKIRQGWMFQGGWSLLSHTQMLIEPSEKKTYFKAYVSEPGGTLVPYECYSSEEDTVMHLKPFKHTYQVSGEIGAKNNPYNNHLTIYTKESKAILTLPNGGMRIYIGDPMRPKKDNSPRYLRLLKEYLPNSHVIHYGYDKKTNLTNVYTSNQDGTSVYAAFQITCYQHKDNPFVLKLNTSVGEELHYRTMCHKERFYLNACENSHAPKQDIQYIESRTLVGPRVQRIYQGDKSPLYAEYYRPTNDKDAEKWAYLPKKKPQHIDKVSRIEEPVGPHGQSRTVATFSYGDRYTDARDHDGLLTRYHHDGDKLLRIEYFDTHDHLASMQKFFWEGERLRTKAFLNSQGHHLFAKTFTYDNLGNVLTETLWGNLTGKSEPLHIDPSGTCFQADHYTKTYTYLSKFNVPLTETEEDGLTYTYHYLHDTNLPTATYTSYQGKILKREFWHYDQDNLLISQSVDDGTDTYRLSTHYTLHSAYKLPEIITETYLDATSGQEKLLRKRILTYSPTKQVLSEDHFDATGTYRYTLYTTYDAQERPIRKTTPSGKENTYSYDPFKNPIAIKEVGSSTRYYTYDHFNRQTSCTQNNKTTYIYYDPKGRITSQTDEQGNTIQNTYDCFGRNIETKYPSIFRCAYDILGNLAEATSPSGNTTQITYTTLRKPITTIDPLGNTTSHTYNKIGLLLRATYPDGSQEKYTYDPFQRPTSKTLYDAQGTLLLQELWEYSTFQLISHTDPRGLKTTYTYDGAGRKIQEQAEDRIITYTYDALGFLTRTQTPHTSHVEIHDIEGLLIEEWDEDTHGHIENSMQFVYDNENRKIQATRITSKGPATDTFAYDDEGHLVLHTDPLGAKTQIHYAHLPHLQKTIIDALGNSTIETEDLQGRPISIEKQDPTGTTCAKEELIYDEEGNKTQRISYVYSDGSLIRTQRSFWEYDHAGRITSSWQDTQAKTHYTYDFQGRLLEKTLPSGITLIHTYDSAGRLLSLKSSDSTIDTTYVYEGLDSTEIHTPTTSIYRTYNSFGQILTENNLSWIYDTSGRCTQFTLQDGSSINYTYSGRHLFSVERGGFIHNYTQFDPQGHVAKETLIGNLGEVETFHDILERTYSQKSLWLEHTVDYGPTSLITHSRDTLTGEKDYTYDALAQLIQEGEDLHPFDSLGNPTNTEIGPANTLPEIFTYDTDGNPIARGSTAYRYDALGRLTHIITPDETTTYTYDGLSRLFSRRAADTVFYLYDQDTEIGTLDHRGNILELKVLGLGIRGDIGAAVAIELHGQTFVPLHDLQGNIVALLDLYGDLVESYRLGAFGRELTTHPPQNPWRFSSKRVEPSGLIFFGLRFYDKDLGRWLTPDPAGFVDGPNLYLYVLNSPLRRLDLFGLFAEDMLPNPMKETFVYVPIARVPRVPGIQRVVGACVFGNVTVDGIVSCGHWHLLQFTPEEQNTGKVNLFEHFHELTPKEGSQVGLVTALNGINTSFYELGTMCDSIANKIGGTLLIGLHNPTRGFFRDALRTVKEKLGFETSTVRRTRQFFSVIGEALHRVNPDAIWLHIPHSEGGVITKRAIEGLGVAKQDILRNMLYIFAVAPAEPIPMNFGIESVNVYSEKDYITGGFSKSFKNNLNYDIQYLQCISSRKERNLFIADHRFLGSTYQNACEGYINNLKGNIGFYEGVPQQLFR